MAEIANILRDVMDGFTNFKFERVSEQNLLLKLRISRPSNSIKPIEYRLGELSDGQKTLIALYTLLYGTKSEDYILCIDEPENFLALPEIQPWLIQLSAILTMKSTSRRIIAFHPLRICIVSAQL